MTNERMKAIKDSIVVLIDKQEKRNLHICSRLSQMGIKFMAVDMDYCDYSFFIPIRDESIDFRKIIGIERKANLGELAANLSHKRTQFEIELAKAKADKCKVFIMIEDENARAKIDLRILLDEDAGYDINKKYSKTWRGDFKGKSMFGTLRDWRKIYGYTFVTCNRDNITDKILTEFYKAIDTYFNSEKE